MLQKLFLNLHKASSLTTRISSRSQLLLMEPLYAIVFETSICSPLPSAAWMFSLRWDWIYSLCQSAGFCSAPLWLQRQLAGTMKREKSEPAEKGIKVHKKDSLSSHWQDQQNLWQHEVGVNNSWQEALPFGSLCCHNIMTLKCLCPVIVVGVSVFWLLRDSCILSLEKIFFF